MIELSKLEKKQLRGVGSFSEDKSPYWWGEKTMPKLAAKGLVESHPEYPKAWRITPAGRLALTMLIEVEGK